jgi:hypothetical protein
MTYQITLTEGYHLTARQKQVIAAGLANGWTKVKSKRIEAVIEAGEGLAFGETGAYRVRLFQNEADSRGQMQQRVSRVAIMARKIESKAQ